MFPRQEVGFYEEQSSKLSVLNAQFSSISIYLCKQVDLSSLTKLRCVFSGHYSSVCVDFGIFVVR